MREFHNMIFAPDSRIPQSLNLAPKTPICDECARDARLREADAKAPKGFFTRLKLKLKNLIKSD